MQLATPIDVISAVRAATIICKTDLRICFFIYATPPFQIFELYDYICFEECGVFSRSVECGVRSEE